MQFSFTVWISTSPLRLNVTETQCGDKAVNTETAAMGQYDSYSYYDLGVIF